MAANNWKLGNVVQFEDDEKHGVISLACDEEIIVVGLSGWSGEARVYDMGTGELKFKLQCNNLQNTPAPFSHDNVVVRIGKNIIVTLTSNENTLTIWDKCGSMLDQDLHKDKEKMAEMKRIQDMPDEEKKIFMEEKTAGMSEEEQYNYAMQIAFGVVEQKNKILTFAVKDDLVYCGTNHGLMVMGNADGEWKALKEIKMDVAVGDIAIDGHIAVLGTMPINEGGSPQGKKITLSMWNIENMEEMEEVDGSKFEVKMFPLLAFAFPNVFLIGGFRGADNTGVEIWNMEKKEMVRHLLKGEKEYEQIHTNGEFITICEEIHSWSSGEEKMLKLAMYEIEELTNQDICDENLTNESFEYSTLDLGSEHIRAVTTSKNLVVNHGGNKFSIMDIIKN